MANKILKLGLNDKKNEATEPAAKPMQPDEFIERRTRAKIYRQIADTFKSASKTSALLAFVALDISLGTRLIQDHYPMFHPVMFEYLTSHYLPIVFDASAAFSGISFMGSKIYNRGANKEEELLRKSGVDKNYVLMCMPRIQIFTKKEPYDPKILIRDSDIDLNSESERLIRDTKKLN